MVGLVETLEVEQKEADCVEEVERVGEAVMDREVVRDTDKLPEEQ